MIIPLHAGGRTDMLLLNQAIRTRAWAFFVPATANYTASPTQSMGGIARKISRVRHCRTDRSNLHGFNRMALAELWFTFPICFSQFKDGVSESVRFLVSIEFTPSKESMFLKTQNRPVISGSAMGQNAKESAHRCGIRSMRYNKSEELQCKVAASGVAPVRTYLFTCVLRSSSQTVR